MGIEFELKYKATPRQQALARQKFPGPEQVIAMETTYYDTPGGALSALRYTLRRRMENGSAVCTLKTPSQLGRCEWEIPCDDILQAIPVFCRMGAPETLPELVRQGLIPVCGAKFTRIAKEIALADCTVELALDAGVLMGGGREIPLCEIEVELKSGSPAAAEGFAQTLAAELGLTEEPLSKFARASNLSKEL